ncbi:MAG: hypothetical protein NTW86_14295 [Candidatus Sumerlaeota bacterium]|nr:hypothetical protein [Candidatus Sumerlaeota bacterium]
MPYDGSKPEKAFKVGAVRAAVWENRRLSSEGKTFSSYKVLVERTYKDEREGFKSTGSLGVDDIPKAILALSKAYEYLLYRKQQKNGEEDDFENWAPLSDIGT